MHTGEISTTLCDERGLQHKTKVCALSLRSGADEAYLVLSRLEVAQHIPLQHDVPAVGKLEYDVVPRRRDMEQLRLDGGTESRAERGVHERNWELGPSVVVPGVSAKDGVVVTYGWMLRRTAVGKQTSTRREYASLRRIISLAVDQARRLRLLWLIAFMEAC